MTSEPTVGEIRKAFEGQPDSAPVKFIFGDQRLRVHEAWPNLTRAEYIIEFQVPENVTFKGDA